MWEAVDTGTWKVRVAETEEEERKQEEIKEKQKKEKKKLKKEYRTEVRKVAEEWEIWNKEEEAAKLEEEIKKLVLAKLSISRSMSSARRQVNGCPQESCRIMQ